MRVAGTLALALLLPLTAFAALININTADQALLETLPGIGSVKAMAIIEYRTTHGPFARIEDIQNVSGIGPATFAGIKDLITVGNVSAPPPTPQGTTTPSSATPASTTYVAPPSSVSVKIFGPRVALQGVPLHLSAQVTTKGGAVDPSARIAWSFGDGSAQTGTEVEKVYEYLGSYVVMVLVHDGSAQASEEFVVSVLPTATTLTLSAQGMTILNDSTERLDLSGWQLRSEAGSFRIPEGTTLLAGMRVLFPYTITNLPVATSATLLYPDGRMAAAYVPATTLSTTSPAEVKPSGVEARIYSIQAVEPISSETPNIVGHEKAVLAPTASTELAAVGAPVSNEKKSSGLLHSPWFLGFLGMIVVAGGAFVLI